MTQRIEGDDKYSSMLIEADSHPKEESQEEKLPDKWSDDPQWYDDNQDIGAFVRWYYEGAHGTVAEICKIFEEPWDYDDGYRDYLMWKEDQRTGRGPW